MLSLARPAAVVQRGQQGRRGEPRADEVGVGPVRRAGRPVGEPVISQKPAIAAMTVPNPANFRRGPVCPFIEVDSMTSDGFTWVRAS